jgi:hypothetical protein
MTLRVLGALAIAGALFLPLFGYAQPVPAEWSTSLFGLARPDREAIDIQVHDTYYIVPETHAAWQAQLAIAAGALTILAAFTRLRRWLWLVSLAWLGGLLAVFWALDPLATSPHFTFYPAGWAAALGGDALMLAAWYEQR